MKIYLVRHGQTSWNQEERLQGLRDVPLNQTGVRQSRRLAEWYRKTGVRRIVSSPLVRARCTAQILGERTACPRYTDDRLREIDHGAWSGLRLKAIQDRFPDQFAAWSFLPEKLRMSSGENLVAVYRRCTQALLDLIKQNPDDDVMVVSHGVVNALLLCAAIGVGPSRIRDYSLHNTSVSAITVQRGKIIAVESKLHVAPE
jgi:broad specificity phosphatase PhoE